ncbi:hypothetical protein ACFXHA_30250 [Nocardia sp. NPDC059240]|uniref:hypothetical protein n=1 Tax=Nocardia sp. NPDC059240 TaxID=3346786 RepID=UPI00368594CE
MKSTLAQRLILLLATCAVAALGATGPAQAAPPTPVPAATAIDGSTASGSGTGSSGVLFDIFCTLVHLSRGLPPGCTFSDMPAVG